MTEHAAPAYLRETILFLGLAGILIPLLQRKRINPVLGFLAVGAMVGPYGLGSLVDRLPWLTPLTFTSTADVATFAEFGVVFLMFMIGLELSVSRLWSMRRLVFGIGGLQVAITAVVIGVIAQHWGHGLKTSLILGLALAFSSTAVVVQLLSQRKEMGTPMGQSTFSVLLFQDLAVVPLLVLVSIMGQQDAPGGFAALLALAVGKAVLTVGVIYVLGRRLVRPIFHNLASTRAPDTFTALTLLASLGVAALTWAAGLSMAMGALLAGLIIAETEFRHQVEVTIEPFRGLLMGLFFMSVGMGIDLHALMREPLWLPLSVIGLMALKAAINVPVLHLAGLSWGRATQGGVLLSQGGEFAFIVIGMAMQFELIPAPVAQFMLLVAGLSMLATPVASHFGSTLGDAIDNRLGRKHGVDQEVVSGSLRDHVIICGCGRVGETVAQLLSSQSVNYVAVDNDAKLVERLRARGVPAYYGDASRPEMLHKLHLDDAAAVVLTINQPLAAMLAVEGIRKAAPELRIIARASDQQNAVTLRRAGADSVVPVTLEPALQLSGLALEHLGHAEETIHQLLESEREERTRAIGLEQ